MKLPLFTLSLLLSLLPGSWEQSERREPEEGDFRLQRFDQHRGRRVMGTGNVMVFHDGQWGIVCDDGWTLQNANVVCHSLGFPNALGYTTQSHFGRPNRRTNVWLDNVQCHGDEMYAMDCEHREVGVHDCDYREAAGVFCNKRGADATQMGVFKRDRPRKTTTTTTTTTTPAPSTSTEAQFRLVEYIDSDQDDRARDAPKDLYLPSVVNREENDVLKASVALHATAVTHYPQRYPVRIMGGRNENEGRVEVYIGGRWGVICSDHWSLMEARIACIQAGKGYARTAMRGGFFEGEDLDKLVSGLRCDGDESSLNECFHTQYRHPVSCEKKQFVAGVVCTDTLPDLVLNGTLLASSAYLQDRSLRQMECALEEFCASSSAFEIASTRTDWHVHQRRLLRFSSSTWNFGTADFRPLLSKGDWEWHLCHMHYHSMNVFATYDILDLHGNQVAEGHKASFCLEDVQCSTGVSKKYACQGFGDQGISVGCADDYLHDIDCQWIDITDVLPGEYIFKVHINPDYLVAELRHDNNAVTCELDYNGYSVKITNCVTGEG